MNASVRSVEYGNSDELAFSDLIDLLLRRKGVIAAVLLFCLAIGIFLALQPRKYSAGSTLRVQLGSSDIYRATQVAPVSTAADPTSPYVEIMQSRTLLLKVAKDLNLQNEPVLMGPSKTGKQLSLDDPAVRERTLLALRGHVAVDHKPKEEVIRVYCTTTSPALSAKIANTLVNDYVEALFQTHLGGTKRTSVFLTRQLDDLKRQVESDQSALTGLQEKLGIIGLNEKDNDYLYTQSLNSMAKAATDATIARIVAQAKYRFLQESDPGLVEGEVNLLQSPGSGSSSVLLQNLRSAQATESSNYEKLRAQFLPNYPELKQLKAQLDETIRQVKAEQDRILNQAKLSYSAASANEKMTEQALASKQGQVFSSRGDMVKYVILLHDYQSHRTLYEDLITRVQEAGITAGLEGGEVDVIDLADVPVLPVRPGPLTYLAGSILAGLVLGCIAVFVVEVFSNRIATSDQGRRAASYPLLGLLPTIPGGNRSLGVATDLAYLESVEGLRSTILRADTNNPPKVIAITSTVPNEGKSTTALHLAAVLAQHKSTVLLIDCNLRQNKIAATLSLSSGKGLSTVLTGSSSLEAALQTIPSAPNLAVLVSGPQQSIRASVLLGSEEMRQLIEGCRERFDRVVLNCPQTLGVSDVLNIGQFADAVVLVMRRNSVSRRELKQAQQVLAASNLPVLGYVFNDASLGHESSYLQTYSLQRAGA